MNDYMEESDICDILCILILDTLFLPSIVFVEACNQYSLSGGTNMLNFTSILKNEGVVPNLCNQQSGHLKLCGMG